MWYNIDWTEFVYQYIPVEVRLPHWMALLQTLIRPVKEIHSLWRSFRENNLYVMAHTGQVCSLRSSLNDTFDPSLRRIRIIDGTIHPRQYVYTHAENRPVFMGRIYVYTADEYADTGVDFFVEVPSSLRAQEYAVRAHVHLYKEASKRFKIIYV